MGKVLIVYHSQSGNTKAAAEALAQGAKQVSGTEVIIKEAYVNGGPVLKRMLPAPQGRAYRIRKRSAHLTLVVENIEEKN